MVKLYCDGDEIRIVDYINDERDGSPCCVFRYADDGIIDIADYKNIIIEVE